MKRIPIKDVNLIINCNNDMPSRISDYLAFLTYYSFYDHFRETLKPLLVIPSVKDTNAHYWASSLKIPILRKVPFFENVIQKPAFYVRSGLLILDQNFDYLNSFDVFENYGIRLISETQNDFSNVGIIGNLDDEFSSSFINLNKNISLKDLVNILNNGFGASYFTRNKKTINRTCFSEVVKKAHVVYLNFPQIR
jgi:hypothetical protein